ncbi:MAG TPA: BON domain-containing protein, partial [Pirellulales bacterium]|nr:BON domain-containing protein [Pirellulales bacterium]
MRRVLWTAALVSSALFAGMVRAGDQETSQQIADSLKSHLKNYSVAVKVQDGTAWLNGFVANPKQMSVAVETAQQTPGVERVVNNLTIGSAAAASPASNLQQPGNVASGAGAASTAQQAVQQTVDTSRLNEFHPSSPYRQQVIQATLDLPEEAKQQLLVAGPIPETEDESASFSSQSAQNLKTSPAHAAQENGAASMASGQPYRANGQTAPGYFPGNAGNGSMNGAYNQGNQMAYNNSNAAYYAPGPGGMAPNASGPMRPTMQSVPLPIGAANPTQYRNAAMQNGGTGGGGEGISPPQPVPSMQPMGPGAPAPYHFDHPQMPGYAWPSYAAYPNYAAVTYPKQYSPTAWPYIGPFYPYPQVPLG